MLKTKDTDNHFWPLHNVWNQFWHWRCLKWHLLTQLEGSQSICYTLHVSYTFLYFTVQLQAVSAGFWKGSHAHLSSHLQPFRIWWHCDFLAPAEHRASRLSAVAVSTGISTGVAVEIEVARCSFFPSKPTINVSLTSCSWFLMAWGRQCHNHR